MIIGCFRGCFSFNAVSRFDKARMNATCHGDYESPSESDIQQILNTLAGEDPETSADEAFQILQSKMQYSEKKNQWNYLVKNLVILDRCVENRYFINDISNIHILHVENYKDPDPNNCIIKIDGFIRKYFQYIKMKSRLYTKQPSSFNVSKSNKKKYLQTLSIDQLFSEMNDAVLLFQFIIDMATTNTDPLQKRLVENNLETSMKIKNYYIQFLKNNELFLQFIEDHKFIKGYEEVKVTDFYQPNISTLIIINDWLALLDNRNNMTNPEAINIKLDKEMQLTKFIVDKVNDYPIYADIQKSVLIEEGSSLYIKQVTSDLKEGMISNYSLDINSFKLDKQDSSNIYNGYSLADGLDKLNLFHSSRMSNENHKGFKLGKAVKNQIKMLENAGTGFQRDFFAGYQNEYSEQFSKNNKYLTQQTLKSKFEKCCLLEDYFSQSFHNHVSFIMNDHIQHQGPSNTIKELPIFEVNIFSEFKNDYSVLTPMHYTFDDSNNLSQSKQLLQSSVINQKDQNEIQLTVKQ